MHVCKGIVRAQYQQMTKQSNPVAQDISKYIKMVTQRLYDPCYTTAERIDAATELMSVATADQTGMVGVLEASDLDRLRRLKNSRLPNELYNELSRLCFLLEQSFNHTLLPDFEPDYSEQLTFLNEITKAIKIDPVIWQSTGPGEKPIKLHPIWRYINSTHNSYSEDPSRVEISLLNLKDAGYIWTALSRIDISANQAQKTKDAVVVSARVWIAMDEVQKLTQQKKDCICEILHGAYTIGALNSTVASISLPSLEVKKPIAAWYVLEYGPNNENSYALLDVKRGQALTAYSIALDRAGISHEQTFKNEDAACLKISRNTFMKITTDQTNKVANFYKNFLNPKLTNAATNSIGLRAAQISAKTSNHTY